MSCYKYVNSHGTRIRYSISWRKYYNYVNSLVVWVVATMLTLMEHEFDIQSLAGSGTTMLTH